MMRLMITSCGLVLWLASCGHGGGDATSASTGRAVSAITATTSSDTTARYRIVARGRFYDSVSYRFNESGTHVICIRNPRKSGINAPTMRPLDFFIYDLAAEIIIFEDSVENGAVTWEDDRRVRVIVTPGTVPGFTPHRYGYRLDIGTGKTVPLEEHVESHRHEALSR